MDNTQANVDFQLKDMYIRKLAPLNIDSTYYAFTNDNGDGTATLYIASTDVAPSIYFAAATYAADGSLADIKFEKASTATVNGAVCATIEITDNAKVMIWDSNMKPLHNSFLGSDI